MLFYSTLQIIILFLPPLTVCLRWYESDPTFVVDLNIYKANALYDELEVDKQMEL